jgi:DeoR/GlpR family transcriptional regulator of sugar metabolism
LGANAFSAQDGLTDVDWEVVEVKKALIRSAKKVAVLSISEKLNTTQRIKICEMSKVNYLVTELAPGNPLLQSYLEADLKII